MKPSRSMGLLLGGTMALSASSTVGPPMMPYPAPMLEPRERARPGTGVTPVLAGSRQSPGRRAQCGPDPAG